MNALPHEPRQLIDAIHEGVAGNDAADELAGAIQGLSRQEQDALLHYWDCRRAGSSPKLAEMLALATPPMSNTDREFLEGRVNNGHIFGGGPLAEDTGNKLKAVAEAGGQSVNGKVYLGGLARFPGDPEAWVSGRGDVQRLVEKRGWKCQGSVEVEPDGLSNERAAEFRERKVSPGPGLDRDEDGHVESLLDGADSRQKIEERMARPELIEQR
jgi:hypothetical protein